jgi:hypothetical protein
MAKQFENITIFREIIDDTGGGRAAEMNLTRAL